MVNSYFNLSYKVYMQCLIIFKVDPSGNSAQPEDFIYLLLDDSECLVDFLEHFENVRY